MPFLPEPKPPTLALRLQTQTPKKEKVTEETQNFPKDEAVEPKEGTAQLQQSCSSASGPGCRVGGPVQRYEIFCVPRKIFINNSHI